jgi:ATP-dependent DNA helicase RecG
VNLFDSITHCPWFNLAQKAKILSIIKEDRIIDLLTFLPKKSTEIIMANNYLDILNQYSKPNTILILLMEIEKVTNLGSKQFIVEGRCYNARCKLLFFKVDRLLYSIYKPQTYVVVQGKVDIINGVITMIHPVHKGNEITTIPFYQIEINYCSNRLKNSFIKKRIYEVLDRLHTLELPQDWIPLPWRQEYNLPSFMDALRGLHGYGSLDMTFIKTSRQRVVLDEIIFYNRLIRNYQHPVHDNRTNRLIRKEIQEIVAAVVDQLHLPFTLKPQQIDALNGIFYDIKYKPPLFRLLQGDVGCGKTVVALIVIHWLNLQGFQGVILSPSLTLAQQHYDYFLKTLPHKDILLFTSHTTANTKERQKMLDFMADGTAKVIIGTHSLLAESIVFKKLAIVIFDEHHKFGVVQRTQLTEKFNGHILSMTATPNPRTMMLANYGFLDVTTIANSVTNNRQTFAVDGTKVEKILQKLNHWIENNEKIYWICSRVESSSDHIVSCIERYESIKNINENQGFNPSMGPHGDTIKGDGPNAYNQASNLVGLVHGQLDPMVINETIANFRDNKIKILVSTTVIEVGIDIKDATIIIIENAEMFGISQLHQLRGRVGRGDLPGKCLLIYNAEKPENVEKIEKFVTMETGFEISNLDLELRGPGELVGTHQKGKKNFKFIDKYTEKFLFSMGSSIAPHAENMEFMAHLLKIDKEEIFLKKN